VTDLMCEAPHERVLRKAADLRRCCIAGGLSMSTDPEADFEDLPIARRAPWIRLATTYCEVFPGVHGA